MPSVFEELVNNPPDLGRVWQGSKSEPRNGPGLVSNSSLGLYTSAALGKQGLLRQGGTDFP
jgi:hypothetical protein